jgi:hypothetical protein
MCSRAKCSTAAKPSQQTARHPNGAKR